MDVDAILIGIDFRQHLNDAVATCDVLLRVGSVHNGKPWNGQTESRRSKIAPPLMKFANGMVFPTDLARQISDEAPTANEGRQFITRDRNTMIGHAYKRVAQGQIMLGVIVIRRICQSARLSRNSN
jgi:hypothetical protein